MRDEENRQLSSRVSQPVEPTLLGLGLIYGQVRGIMNKVNSLGWLTLAGFWLPGVRIGC